MKKTEKCGIMLTVIDGYLICPRCHQNKRLQYVDRKTVAKNLPCYCRMCKSRIYIDIVEGQCFESQGQ